MNNLCVKLICLFMIAANLTAGINNENGIEPYEKLYESFDNSVCEYRIQGSCYVKKSGGGTDEQLGLIICGLKEYLGQVSVQGIGEYDYNIDFFDEAYKGGIEISPYKDENKITVWADIREENVNYKNIERLKNDFTKALSKAGSNVEYSLSIKSKIISSTIDEVYKKTLETLYGCGLKNIKSVRINNGYSIVAGSDIKRDRKTLYENERLQCAVVKYSSGCYLIIGTPEILITY